MNEAQAVSKWLFATLGADSGVSALVGSRLYDSLGPQGAALPYVVWGLNSAQVTPAAGADRRVLTRQRVVISCYAEGGGYADADALAAAVDAALEGVSGSVTVGAQDYWIASAQMEQPLRALETDAGRRVYRSGGIYLILAHGLP